MRGTRAAALIMLGVVVVQAAPLVSIGLGRDGAATIALILGWGAPPIPWFAWVLGAAIALIYGALSMASLPFIRAHLFDLTALKLMSVLFAVVTGMFEELFFRKWLMDALAEHGWSIAVQILASGIGFGVAHAIWGLLGRNVTAAGKSMLFTTGMGLALAIVYSLAGRQLAPAVWSHIAINLIIEPWLMLAVINLRAAPGDGASAQPAD
jgi:membrane protease YdiL (CAAX protease family)